MSCPRRWRCSDCEDVLIHQWNRGPHESSSAFGQFIHDEVTKHTSVGDVDVQLLVADDGAVHSQDAQLQQLHFGFEGPQRLRIFEQKRPGQELREAQRWFLSCWRRLIYLGKRDLEIGGASGVFVVESEPPFDDLLVTRYDWNQEPIPRQFNRADFIWWMGGPQK